MWFHFASKSSCKLQDIEFHSQVWSAQDSTNNSVSNCTFKVVFVAGYIHLWGETVTGGHLPILQDISWVHFRRFIHLGFHPLPISWISPVFSSIQEKEKNEELGRYTTVYFSLTTMTRAGPVHFASAHSSSFVFLTVCSEGQTDEKLSLHDPMAAHSSWQPCAQSQCAGSACSNDLISILPRRSRWVHRCADRPQSHGIAEPTHTIRR